MQYFRFHVGILTALIACFCDIAIDLLSVQKYSALKNGKFFDTAFVTNK